MTPDSPKNGSASSAVNGWLGNAMADAAVASGFLDASQLTLSARSDHRGKLEIPGAYWTRDNAELASTRSIRAVLSLPGATVTPS